MTIKTDAELDASLTSDERLVEIGRLRAALTEWEINFKRQGIMLKNCDEMLKEANAELATARAQNTLLAQSNVYCDKERIIAQSALMTARASEREQCAKIAEEFPTLVTPFMCKAIAKKIRARKDEPAQGEG